MQSTSDNLKQQIMIHADAACPDFVTDRQEWHDIILATMDNSSEVELAEILEEWQEWEPPQ